MSAPVTPVARILIVDDEARQMTALCDTLRDQGYDAVGYTSGEEALVALRDGSFDLLLTDLMMPGLDGINLLRAAQESDKHLVGVMMTGHGAIDTAVAAMKAGALDYILKPFKLSIVLPVLTRALTVRRLRLENAALEAQVRARTTELEMANKELEAFSYSVSHDLRAPVRRMEGFTQLLLQGHSESLSPNGRRLLENVSANSQHMGRLIEDLLNLSRFSRQPLSKRVLSLASLVQEVLAEFAREREGRQIEIRLGALPYCFGDKTLLRQVFINLIGNALKFTRKRDVAILEVACEEKDGELVCTVRDNGAGFDMEFADKLFGAFQRFHRPEEFEGTGVGLSIVQRIIHRHGGRIWVETAVDQGAAFHFSLPLGAPVAAGAPNSSLNPSPA